MYPLPNGRVFGDAADYIFANPRVIDEHYYMMKIDWQASERDSIAGRYTLDDATRQVFLGLDQVIDDSKSRAQYLMLEWKRVFSSRLVNEARVSFNRPFNGDNPVFIKAFPSTMHFNPLAFTFTGKPWYGLVGVAGGAVTTLGFSNVFGKQNAPNRFQYTERT